MATGTGQLAFFIEVGLARTLTSNANQTVQGLSGSTDVSEVSKFIMVRTSYFSH
jgi:hypothetical protein